MNFGLRAPPRTVFDLKKQFLGVNKNTPDAVTLTLHAHDYLKRPQNMNLLFFVFQMFTLLVFIYPPSCLTIFKRVPSDECYTTLTLSDECYTTL